jgi:hypothetical protein
MNVRAHISLVILTMGCITMPVTADIKLNPLMDRLTKISTTQITALIATLGLVFWYKKSKVRPIRCTYDDFIHGRNLQYATDIIPGFPKLPGKVTIRNENGVPVTMKYRDEVKGYGLLYLIESNAKYLGRAASWPAILLGLMLVLDSKKEDTFDFIKTAFGWLVGHNSKQKPF